VLVRRRTSAIAVLCPISAARRHQPVAASESRATPTPAARDGGVSVFGSGANPCSTAGRTCPISTGGGTRRVQLVREGGGGGGMTVPRAKHRPSSNAASASSGAACRSITTACARRARARVRRPLRAARSARAGAGRRLLARGRRSDGNNTPRGDHLRECEYPVGGSIKGVRISRGGNHQGSAGIPVSGRGGAWAGSGATPCPSMRYRARASCAGRKPCGEARAVSSVQHCRDRTLVR
jgi:hypothetical protein